MKKLKILWMIPKWTLPVNDGARVATDSLIRNTIAQGAVVDVLSLANSTEVTDAEEMKKLWGVRNVAEVKRSLPEKSLQKKIYYLWNFFKSPFTPITFSSFGAPEIADGVRDIIKKGDYDFVLLDGLHLAVPLWKKEIGKYGLKIIYRAHNIEADLWLKAYKEKKNPLLKLILYFQFILINRFEQKVIQNSKGVAAISKEDFAFIEKESPKNLELIPLGLKFNNKLPPTKNKNPKFLFIGRLDWPPNRDGLEWVLKEVWPSVIAKRPDARLKIVGAGNKDWLKSYSHLGGLEIIGLIPDVKDAYSDCQFTIVPVFYGSGTRIKVIESFAMGRKLICTKMGVQGADLDESDYIQAETRENWIEILSTVKLTDDIQTSLDKSCEKVAKNFDEKEIGKSFYEWLGKLL